jgi:hypothetical protein
MRSILIAAALAFASVAADAKDLETTHLKSGLSSNV